MQGQSICGKKDTNKKGKKPLKKVHTYQNLLLKLKNFEHCSIVNCLILLHEVYLILILILTLFFRLFAIHNYKDEKC